MDKIKNFFLFCSGVDNAILAKCPSDENKYVGIGATVFFTGVLAFFSSGYALYTVFDSWFFAVAFGLIWGLMIFNLDRYIVSSMKSYGKWWRDLVIAAPRLGLAVLLALVISKPLELKIFEKEINAELIVMEQEVFKQQEDRVKVRYEAQIAEHRQQIELLKADLVAKTAARDTLARIAAQEADGTGGSGRPNLGPIYRAKKADADKAQAELDSLFAVALPTIQQNERAIAVADSTVQAEIAALARTAYDGMAARMEGLSRLAQNSQAIFFASIFIMLLFVAIETSPIFVKLISYRSPYDYLLHQHEHVFEMANLEQVTLLANEVKGKVKIDTDVKTHRVLAEISAQKELINHKVRERVEELKRRPYDWKVGKAVLD